jgi:hypothetical protein
LEHAFLEKNKKWSCINCKQRRCGLCQPIGSNLRIHKLPKRFVGINTKQYFITAKETPGGNWILVKNIIAEQITRKRRIFKKHLVYKRKYLLSNVSSHITSDIIRLDTVLLFHLFYNKFWKKYMIYNYKRLKS